MTNSNHGFPKSKYNKHAWIVGKPEIGERVWIGAFTLIDALHAPLKIGRGTDVSSGAQILTHSTVTRAISEKRHGEVDAAPSEVGEFCFIGTNAVILMGAKVGHHSVIAAGAIVPQFMKVPPYSIVSGVPAKIVGSSKKFLKGVERESISITIPAFNEEKNIEEVVKEAKAAASKIVKDYEIVLVDDGSTDKTGKIMDGLARKDKHLKIFHHQRNKGFTGAMKTALYSARKHLVFLAPADGQFDFNELYKFVASIRGYDGAIGYRTKAYKEPVRQIFTWGFHTLAKNLLSIPFKEFSTVFMIRKRVIDSIKIEAEDRSAMFLPEFFAKAVRANYKFVEVPIHWRKRRGGESKISGVRVIKIILKTFWGMLSLRLKESRRV